jgi:hypothetical protein
MSAAEQVDGEHNRAVGAGHPSQPPFHAQGDFSPWVAPEVAATMVAFLINEEATHSVARGCRYSGPFNAPHRSRLSSVALRARALSTAPARVTQVTREP